MKNTKLYLILFTALVTLVSCSPESIYRLYSDEEDDESVMYKGMEFLISETDQTTAIIAYYRHYDERIIMDLEVMNHSDNWIRFDPVDVQYEAYQMKFEYEDDIQDGEWREVLVAKGEALDPEEFLLQIDRDRSKAEANERTNYIFDAIGSGVRLMEDVSTINQLSSSEKTTREIQRTNRAIERAERRNRYYKQIGNLAEKRAYWETQTLRTTDLEPGESIAGEISFPISEESKIVVFTVAIGDDMHSFRYNQRQYSP